MNEQVQPFPGGEIVLVAVVGNPDAAHQFHDEIRPASIGRAGVQHLGDARVIHQGQGLPLRLEAGDDALGVHPQLDDLERDAPVNRFLLLGHINHAAAPFANLLEEFVAANAVAGFLGENRRQANRSAPPRSARSCRKWLRSGRRVFEEAARFFAGLQEFFDTLT